MTSIVAKTGVLPRVQGRWLDLEWARQASTQARSGRTCSTTPSIDIVGRVIHVLRAIPDAAAGRKLSLRRTRVVREERPSAVGSELRRKLVPPTPHLSLERRLALPSTNASNATPTASHQAAYRAARMRIPEPSGSRD